MEKALNNKQDTVDSIKTGGTVQQPPPPPPPPVVIVSPQTSSTIDCRELHVGKLIGSGEFAGKSYLNFKIHSSTKKIFFLFLLFYSIK